MEQDFAVVEIEIDVEEEVEEEEEGADEVAATQIQTGSPVGL